MPPPLTLWRHVTFSTRNSWLPGDPRGFRTRKHKLHSSGDHRHPPPVGEHAGLHRHAQAVSGEPVTLPPPWRASVGQIVQAKLVQHGHEVLAVSVSAWHVHVLAALPIDVAEARQAVGHAKRAASHALRDALPGRVWAAGCKLKPIRDRRHQRNTFQYILDHANEGAWVWDFREG